MTTHSDQTSSDRSPSTPEQRRLGASAAQVISPPGRRAGLLRLQRTVGNRAVSDLVAQHRRGPAGPDRASGVKGSHGSGLQRSAPFPTGPVVVQRQPTPEQQRAVAAELNAILVAAKKKPKAVRDLAGRIAALKDAAVAAHLDQTNPSAFGAILDLEAASGEKEVKSLLGRFDPDQRKGSQGYTHAAAAMFSPVVYGVATSPEYMRMRSNELAKQAVGTGALSEEIEADVQINIVLNQLAEAYALHLQRHGTDTTFTHTILVFIGGEWTFVPQHTGKLSETWSDPVKAEAKAKPTQYEDRDRLIRRRPYTREQKDRIIDIFRQVSRLYPEMVIMPGTIVSAEAKKGGEWKNMTNTAFVVWNGNLMKTVDKQRAAGDEKFLEGDLELKAGKGSSFFTLGDLRFALEICADHDKGRAAAEKKQADIQLVSGAGQLAQAKSSVVHAGGAVFSADSDAGAFGYLAGGSQSTMVNADVTVGANAHLTQKGMPRPGAGMMGYLDPRTVVVDAKTGNRVAVLS